MMIASYSCIALALPNDGVAEFHSRKLLAVSPEGVILSCPPAPPPAILNRIELAARYSAGYRAGRP